MSARYYAFEPDPRDVGLVVKDGDEHVIWWWDGHVDSVERRARLYSPEAGGYLRRVLVRDMTPQQRARAAEARTRGTDPAALARRRDAIKANLKPMPEARRNTSDELDMSED